MGRTKRKSTAIAKQAAQLKIGEIFYLGNVKRLLKCCGYSKYGDVLYEPVKENDYHIYRLNSSAVVYIREEKK